MANYGTGGYVNTTGSGYSNNVLAGNRHSTEPTAGTIYADPQFAGPVPSGATGISGAQSYRLVASSPAIRAGVTTSVQGTRDFAGAALPASAPSAGAFEGGLANPIANAGLDRGSLSPWTTSGSGTATTLTTTGPATGTHAAQTGAVNSGIQQVVTGLTPGATYRLTASLRVQNAGERIALGVKDYGGNEVFAQSTSSSWTPVTQYFTLGANSSQATVYCYKNGGVGAGFCDAFSLVQVTAAADVVANGGFESGVLGAWATSGSGTASTVATTAARTGTYGLSTGSANSGVQQTITGLSAGTTYVLSGWLRTGAGEEIAIGAKNFGGAELFRRVSGSPYAPATVVFTTGNATTSATLYCYKNDGSAAGACDDIRLTKLQ